MGQIILSEILLKDLVEQVASASSEKILEKIEESLRIKLEEKQKFKELNRKETALLLEITPPTVDRYTKEKLLTKYGIGKRGKYLLHEVEAARPAIMASLHKWNIPSKRFTSK